MRIVKAQAATVLRAENTMLQSQKSRCAEQASNLSSMVLEGMRGKAGTELEQACRNHAALATSHLVFYETLVQANTQHISLVEGLPETSAGVLDTNVAELRLRDARTRLADLVQERDEAIALAERTNEETQQAMVFASPGSAIVSPPFVDTFAIRQRYESLMRVEELVIRLNQSILDEATSYDRASCALYAGVRTDALRSGDEASATFLKTGSWGGDSWIGTVTASALFMRSTKPEEGESKVMAFVKSFLSGDLAVEGSLVDGGARAEGEHAGVPITGAVAGSAVGFGFSLKPYAKSENAKDAKDAKDAKKKSTAGAKAKAEVYGAKGEATGSIGMAQADVKLTVASGAVIGTVGASLGSAGSFDPSVELEAKAEASAAQVQTDARVGDSNYNVHGKAEAKVLTASAKAKVELSGERIEAKVGAEAYVATGELSAGFTFLGVKVDASVEAKVGGAGAHADASVGTSSVEGSLGAGLGFGAGIKVKVDWSGAARALADLGNGIGEWWGGLANT